MDKKIDKQKQAEYAKKYNAQRASKEEYCNACRMPVKMISLLKHNQSKKHIQNSNKNVKSELESMIMEIFEKYKNGKMIFTDFKDELSILLDDVDEAEQKDNKVMPKYNTEEERKFCEQPYASMSMELEEIIENVESLTLQEDYEDQKNKIDSSDTNAKILLLNLWRRIKNPKVKTIEEPKPIKTIEEPKVVKKVERIEYLEDEFPQLHLFKNASNRAKYETLSFIKDSHMYIFDDNNEYVLKELVETLEDNIEENYDELYDVILGLKKEYDINERRRATTIDMNREEEDEEEEEEDDF